MAIGCGGGGDDPQPPSSGVTSASRTGVRFFIEKDGKRVPFMVGAPSFLDRVFGMQANPPTGTTQSALHKKDVTMTGDYPDVDSEMLGYNALLWGAAVECGVGVPADVPNDKPHTAVPGFAKRSQTALLPAQPWFAFGWFDNAYYILSNPPATCDELLEDEETMLCMADKLTEVATSTKTVRWLNPGVVPAPGQTPIGGTWVFPPQATQDRWTARDVALHVLAQIPRMSGDRVGPTSCARQYAAAAVPQQAMQSSQTLFGVNPGEAPHYPPTSTKVGDSNAPRLATERLAFEAQVLRASARLMKELVDDIAYETLGTMEKRRAAAADPVAGNRIALGDATDIVENNAFTVLAANLVNFPNGPQHCDYSRPARSNDDWYGADLGARLEDVPVPTTSAKLAVALVESSGVVLPTGMLGQKTDGDLKTLLTNALLNDRAGRNHVEVDQLGNSGAAIQAQVDGLADVDVRFAFQRNLRTFRALTGQGSDVDVSHPEAYGLAANPRATIAGGVVLDGGLSRSAIWGDPIARMGNAMELAQCPEPTGQNVLTTADNPPPPQLVHVTNTGTFSTPGPQWRDSAPFHIGQNTTALGQAMLRRLAVIDEEIAAGPLGASSRVGQPAAQIAKAAIGEIATWAGTGQLAATVSGEGQPRQLTLDLSGVDEDLIGGAQLDGNMVLAYGPAWVAECASGLRTQCPADFEAKYTIPLTGALRDATPDERKNAGRLRKVTQTTVNEADLVRVGVMYADSAPKDTHLFLVRRAPVGNHGGVVFTPIATPRPNAGWSTVVIPIAPIGSGMREVIGQTLASGAKFQKPGLYDSTLSEPASYCIKDVAADTFVPLENELTSDSDSFENSWKHYLTQAKLAAQRADDLGNQLIAQGTQLELRREAAGETIAGICGNPVTLTDTAFDADGHMRPADGDVALKACLSEETKDVVFLSKNPTPPGESPAAYVRNLLRCDDPSYKGPKNHLCEKTTWTIDSLGLTDAPVAVDNTDPHACDAMVFAWATMSGPGFDSVLFSNALSQKWFERLPLVANTLKLHVTDDGEWFVESGGNNVMSSLAADGANGVWPACIAAGKCDFDKRPWDALLNLVFRACPWATDNPVPGSAYRAPAALGSCEDSSDRTRAELNAIRWRLQGGLWQLGTMTGSVPPDMIETYVPAANFAAGGWTPADKPIALDPTVYPGGSIFGYSSDGTMGLLDPAPPSIRAQLKRVVPVHDNFAKLGSQFLSVEADPTTVEIYQPDRIGQYKHVAASNAGYAPNYTMLAGAPTGAYATPGCSGCDGSVLSADLLRALAVVNGAPRFVCSYSANNPASASANAWSRLQSDDWFVKTDDDGKHTLATNGPLTWYNGGGYGAVPGDGLPYWGLSYGKFIVRSNVDFDFGNPADRVRYFVAAPPSSSVCGPARRLIHALTLGCGLQMLPPQALAAADASPPAIEGIEDLARLDSWLMSVTVAASDQMSRLFITNVPSRVVSDIKSNRVGTGSTSGEVGDKLLELESELQTLNSSWREVVGDLQHIRQAIGMARLRVAAAGLARDDKMARLAIERFQMYAGMASVVTSELSVLSQFDSLGTKDIGAGVQIALIGEQLALLPSLENVADKDHANAVAQALAELDTATLSHWINAEKSLNAIRTSNARSLEIINQRVRLEDRAAYEAAKGAGADFVSIDGRTVPVPVNTVLRRQYDVTALRYKEALRQAKYFAFLARRAIEQRIGIPLNKLSRPIGTLAAPASWVEDVCTLSGIDYKKLRTASPGATDDDVIASFADQYIGDYVAKLEEFVEYYNVEYPSHEGDDVALLSLREDLLDSGKMCFVDSPNLLYFSGRLDAVPAGANGWLKHPCATDVSTCLGAFPRAALPTDLELPEGAVRGDATWLKNVPLDPGAPSSPSSGDLASAPTNMVSQSVHLQPGTYVISWWDQARATDGNLTDATGVEYRMAVYDGKWSPVPGASFVGTPKAAENDGTPPAKHLKSAWSARHAVTFEVATTGDYHVGFAASTSTSLSGSVVIANVQLEQVPAPREPSAYSATDATRKVPSTTCPIRSSAELRSAFSWRCDSEGRCYYELDQPLSIDTQGLASTDGTHLPTSAKSRLEGKIAAGNFNYRHVTVGLNLVGTGVRDCGSSGTPACYGTGFQEYSLVHEANRIKILTWNPAESYKFDFGRAHIEHAKALAAERYLTVPFSSADSGLLAQPGIEKAELRGRPLDGRYELKIWDSPSLRWDRVDDIQLVLKYHYWSAIERP